MAAALLRERVVGLRRDGLTFAAIGRIVGRSEAQAFRYWQRALDLSRSRASETIAQAIELELMRLDDWTIELDAVLTDPLGVLASGLAVDVEDIPRATAALDGAAATNLKLKAIDRLVRISQRRSELLGLNAPQKVEDNPTAGASPVFIAVALRAALASAADCKSGADSSPGAQLAHNGADWAKRLGLPAGGAR